MKYGLVFVNGTPFDDPVHTKRLLERIGPIRQTHYGGFYDFVPDMAKADTAYTNIALAAHTDTTYFTDPAGVSYPSHYNHIEMLNKLTHIFSCKPSTCCRIHHHQVHQRESKPQGANLFLWMASMLLNNSRTSILHCLPHSSDL